MNGTGIGAARPHNILLDRDVCGLGGLLQSGDHSGVADDGGIHYLDSCTLAQLDSAAALAAGGIVHVGDVHCQSVVRVDGPGRRLGSPQAHLLLNGEDQVQVVGAVLQPGQHVQEDSAGNAVVEVRGNYFIPIANGGGIIDRRVPYLDQLLGGILIGSADIHIAGVQLEPLELRFLLLGKYTPHPVFKAYRGVQSLAGGDAAHPAQTEEPFLLDVGDNEANGVHVGAQHHPGAGALLVDDEVAQGVGGHLVGVRGSQAGDGLPHVSLVPGGAVSGVEGFDPFKQFHGKTSYFVA